MSWADPLPRRTLLTGLVGGLVWASLPPAPAAAADAVLRRRLDLWRSYAAATHDLVADLTTTRHSALLAGDAPLVRDGLLYFRAPDLLILHDRDPAGSTTVIRGDRGSIHPHHAAAEGPGPRVIRPGSGPSTPALRWLAARLVGAFAPPPADPAAPSALETDARLTRPRGPGIRLAILPPRESAIQRIYRSLTLTLAPTSGAIVAIEIAETAGDLLRLDLRDHRQNPEPAALATTLQTLGALVQGLDGSPQAPAPER